MGGDPPQAPRTCETTENPHSPQIHGIWKVLLEGTEVYRAESRIAATLEKFGHDTPDDWIERKLYAKYTRHGVGVMMVIDLVLFGPIGLTIWAVQMLWIPFFAAGVVNGVGHYWGYRRFAPNDASRNVVPWGILIGGEELHNNHHAYVTSARLSSKWWELDIGWMYIRLLEMLRLAKVRKVAPRIHHNTAATLTLCRLSSRIATRYWPGLPDPCTGPPWRKSPAWLAARSPDRWIPG